MAALSPGRTIAINENAERIFNIAITRFIYQTKIPAGFVRVFDIRQKKG